MIAAVIVLVWATLALGVALVLARGIRIADHRAPFTDHLAGLPEDLTVDDVLGLEPPLARR
jgi:hypothetical protein